MILALALSAPLAAPAFGQADIERIAAGPDLEIRVSEGVTVRLPGPASTIMVADPSIADLQAPSQTVTFVFGKKAGSTSLYALDAEGNTIFSRRITVYQSADDLRRLLRAEVGDHGITVSRTRSGLLISGTVPTAEVAEAAREVALQFVGKEGTLVDRLKVSGKLQVNLRVRVVEVSRAVTKELGINWSAAGSVGEFAVELATGRTGLGAAGSLVRSATGADALAGSVSGRRGSLTAVVDALAERGLVSILAQPNLTAVSGESASFLAGGEFPIPVAQGDNRVSVEYRRFGVSLDFVPTVVSDKLISMRVRPEVSELAEQSAGQVRGFTIPFVTTRRAETTVELASGQSFAIGGLIRNASERKLRALPGLGELPILGALFQSERFQRNESELIIIVTPTIVRAAAGEALLQTPSITPSRPVPGQDPSPAPPVPVVAAKPKPRPIRTAGPCHRAPSLAYVLRDTAPAPVSKDPLPAGSKRACAPPVTSAQVHAGEPGIKGGLRLAN